MSKKAGITLGLIILALFSHAQNAELNPNIDNASSNLDENNATIKCEEHLSKYRKSFVQAIISFEDVCDTNDVDLALLHEHQVAAQIVRTYQTTAWAFFQLFMAQFNDDDQFANDLRNAVIERCRLKLQHQYDMKRNTVVLGKKQRFHSWGGKRAALPKATTDATVVVDAVVKGSNKRNDGNVLKNAFYTL